MFCRHVVVVLVVLVVVMKLQGYSAGIGGIKGPRLWVTRTLFRNASQQSRQHSVFYIHLVQLMSSPFLCIDKPNDILIGALSPLRVLEKKVCQLWL